MTKRVAFYEKGSWYHRTRILKEDYSVSYSKKGGFATEEEAEKSYYRYEDLFLKQSLGTKDKISSDIDFKDYLIYWFYNIFSPRIQGTTKMTYSYALFKNIIPNIEENVQMKYLSSLYINDILLQISKNTTPSITEKSYELLRIFLKDALYMDVIRNNFVSEIKTYKRKSKPVNILTKKQLKELLQISCDSSWYLEILLAVFCGLRKGEISGLKFSDFDLTEKTVTISRQLSIDYGDAETNEPIHDYYYVEKEPKSFSSYRKMKVPDIIIEELMNRMDYIEKLKTENPDFIDKGYISCRINGEPHHTTTINTYLRRTCARYKLPHVTVHGLRHMFATILAEQGVELVKISGLLGHDSIHTTFEYYCDVIEDTDKINEYMNMAFPKKEN